jgi:hypothetical protein
MRLIWLMWTDEWIDLGPSKGFSKFLNVENVENITFLLLLMTDKVGLIMLM